MKSVEKEKKNRKKKSDTHVQEAVENVWDRVCRKEETYDWRTEREYVMNEMEEEEESLWW